MVLRLWDSMVWMRTLSFLQRREGVLGMDHLVVLLFHQCITFCILRLRKYTKSYKLYKRLRTSLVTPHTSSPSGMTVDSQLGITLPHSYSGCKLNFLQTFLSRQILACFLFFVTCYMITGANSEGKIAYTIMRKHSWKINCEKDEPLVDLVFRTLDNTTKVAKNSAIL